MVTWEMEYHLYDSPLYLFPTPLQVSRQYSITELSLLPGSYYVGKDIYVSMEPRQNEFMDRTIPCGLLYYIGLGCKGYFVPEKTAEVFSKVVIVIESGIESMK